MENPKTVGCKKCETCNRFKLMGIQCNAESISDCTLDEKYFLLEEGAKKENTAPIKIVLTEVEGQPGNHPDHSAGSILTTFEITMKIDKKTLQPYFSKPISLEDLLELIEARK